MTPTFGLILLMAETGLILRATLRVAGDNDRLIPLGVWIAVVAGSLTLAALPPLTG